MKIGIVGAGPAGLFTAKNLIKDFELKVFEEHNSIGFPQHCTGLVTEKVVEKIGNDLVLNKIKCSKIFHGKNMIIVEKKGIAAYVIDRKKMEEKLSAEIIENILFGVRVKNLKVDKKIKLETNNGEFDFDILIGADGPRSLVRNFVIQSNIPFLNGIQYLLDNKDFDNDYVEIYLDRKYSSGFFAWTVPRKDDLLVGLSTYDNAPVQRINALLKDKFGNRNVNGVIAGQIPIGILKKHSNENIFLTGDAALFVKATSGGGLYYGLMGSEILANSIKNGYSYEDELLPIIKELKVDYLIHKIFSNLSDEEIARLMKIMKDENIIEKINNYGDIDHPSILAKKLMFEPKFLLAKILLFKKFFNSILYL